MKVEAQHDYLEANATEFVKKIDIGFGEQGMWVYLEIRDYEEPEAGYLDFSGHASWQSLLDEYVREVIEDCTDRYGILDVGDLRESCGELIAVLGPFVERLRTLPEAVAQP
jgi:hypothetical protein